MDDCRSRPGLPILRRFRGQRGPGAALFDRLCQAALGPTRELAHGPRDRAFTAGRDPVTAHWCEQPRGGTASPTELEQVAVLRRSAACLAVECQHLEIAEQLYHLVLGVGSADAWRTIASSAALARVRVRVVRRGLSTARYSGICSTRSQPNSTSSRAEASVFKVSHAPSQTTICRGLAGSS